MKYPISMVRIPGDKMGWYLKVKDGDTDALYYMGEGEKGRAIAERTLGGWVDMFEMGYRLAVQKMKLKIDKMPKV